MRYFIQCRKPRSAYDEDGDYVSDHVPTVCDHEAINTGLLDMNGDVIMRAPNPIGFIWDVD